MDDAQRYLTNAAECLSAAERCQPPYRGLTLAIGTSWLSLARQQEAVDELLAIWSRAHSTTPSASSGQHFQYPRTPGSSATSPGCSRSEFRAGSTRRV
jgi:hypothetical protein